MSWCINLFVMSTFVNFNIIDEKFFLWLFFEIHLKFFIFKLEWNVTFIFFNILIVFFSHFSLWLKMFFTRISCIITTLIWRFRFASSKISFVYFRYFSMFCVISHCWSWARWLLQNDIVSSVCSFANFASSRCLVSFSQSLSTSSFVSIEFSFVRSL